VRNKRKLSKSTKKIASKAKAKTTKRKAIHRVAKASARATHKVGKSYTSATRKARKSLAPANRKVVKPLASKIPARPTTRPAQKSVSAVLTQLTLPLRKKLRASPTQRANRSGVRSVSNAPVLRRHVVHLAHPPQFNYMKAPGIENEFNVGDIVEVFCDHERDSERVRGWIKGIVVQVDNKLVAVQFRSNVFLTDGWMVPDRILWYSLTSDQIRTATFAKRGSRKIIPDY
jgi:hypothetical protein